MIRECTVADAESIRAIINKAAKAYEGVIPADCYHQPYMTMDELRGEMRQMSFYGWEEAGKLVAVMGFQPLGEVTLIRHAYVLQEWQRRGIGSKLLSQLKQLVATPCLLVGTWADVHWAIAFYRKHGFKPLPEKDEMLQKYWSIPERQRETSIVMSINIKNKF